MFLPDHPENFNDVSRAMAVLQSVTSYRISQSIHVVAKLGIADLLKDGAKSSEELAKITDSHAPSLYRVLRALASIGIFAEDLNGRFELTPLGSCLQTDISNSMRASAIIRSEDVYRKPWGHLLHTVKTGETAFRHVYNMGLFDYLAQNPQTAELFDGAMTNYSATIQDAVLAAYDFSSIQKLVDIGGGQGSLIAAILTKYPTMQGILFDQAPVLERAKPLLEAFGVANRCQLIAGDFFSSVPNGADAYIMKNIIHDWDDKQAITILNNCYQAMPKNAKLLLVEAVIFPGNESSVAKLLDLEMLVLTGGQERTEAQHQALFQASGLQLTKIISTNSWQSVIEGVRP
ncbi:methyltransferase [Dulcicalothrix desertica PCC 7102]|uniref:Methyltransferase n=1 Tax=Dulcicalothrix desertica PCC 7102 TaxID=232991 RepID=A0A3S1CJV9_9CYAN|nr:methyltransferase [Dulcicalothrix desertica]RUT04218.1 methyltransferase [Dulcicalothrix desertica PCC 7102]TWH51478.1 O-methyltransferase [Dulcicalothrix desertica PCC 7102]